jgi:hypothetical protein
MKHEIKQDDIKHSKVHQNDASSVLLVVCILSHLHKELCLAEWNRKKAEKHLDTDVSIKGPQLVCFVTTNILRAT